MGFRLLFVYLILYFFPFPNGLVKPPWLGSLFNGVWAKVVLWAGDPAHISIPNFGDNGSADTTYDQLRVVCMGAIAMAATLIWSVLDRRRGDYRGLSAWSRVWMRYVLAICMLTYGAVKVLAEVTGGLLLFFRRTTTLGALIVAGIIVNVVMFNMSYDVPLKLGSSHILLLSLVLLAPDARRLLDFFVLNRPARPADLGPRLASHQLS